jgi:hypothetical protein
MIRGRASVCIAVPIAPAKHTPTFETEGVMVFVPDIIPLLLQRLDKVATPGLIGAAVAEKDSFRSFCLRYTRCSSPER